MDLERCVGYFMGVDGSELVLIRDSGGAIVPYVGSEADGYTDLTRGLPHQDQVTFTARIAAFRALPEYREAFRL